MEGVSSIFFYFFFFFYTFSFLVFSFSFFPLLQVSFVEAESLFQSYEHCRPANSSELFNNCLANYIYNSSLADDDGNNINDFTDDDNNNNRFWGTITLTSGQEYILETQNTYLIWNMTLHTSDDGPPAIVKLGHLNQEEGLFMIFNNGASIQMENIDFQANNGTVTTTTTPTNGVFINALVQYDPQLSLADCFIRNYDSTSPHTAFYQGWKRCQDYKFYIF